MHTLIIETGHIILIPFEKISHLVQTQTGQTCFALARICISLYALCTIKVLYWYAVHENFILIGILALLVALIPKAVFDESHKLEERVADSVKNPLAIKVDFVIGRTVLLIASMVSLRSWTLGNSMASSAFALAFFAISLHFLSCTPLPPKPDEEEEVLKEVALEGAN